MTFSLGGLASGIDTTSIVDSLVAVAQQPITALDKRKAQLDSASQTISSLSTKLAALKTASLALSTSVGFSSFTATSSDAAVVTSTTGSANVGSYDIAVTALARAQKTRSTSFPSSTTALNLAGSLDLQVGTGTAVPVAVLATDTLTDIAAKITSSGAKVSASVVKDGTGSRLFIQGLETGAENAFTVTENGADFGFSASGSTYQTAQDAALTIDTLPITSKTNQITDAIPGVKLALTKLTTSPATVQVAADPATLKQKITSFVNAYNDVVNAGHSAAGFGGTKATNSVLAADSAVRAALHTIGGMFSTEIPGTSGLYTTMGSIGLGVSRDGTLSLNATKFDAAVGASPESVRRLFVTDTATGATGLMTSMMSTVDKLLAAKGPIQSRINSFSAQSKRLADSRIKMQERVDDYGEHLKKQFTAMDQLISKYKTQGAALDAATSTNNSSGSNDG